MSLRQNFRTKYELTKLSRRPSRPQSNHGLLRMHSGPRHLVARSQREFTIQDRGGIWHKANGCRGKELVGTDGVGHDLGLKERSLS